MKIAVASGKGGTGKTLVSTNLFSVLKDSAFLDCDVEEPNGHIFLKPNETKIIPVDVKTPVVDEAKCSHCGKCAQVCNFNAILSAKQKVLVFPELCHSCGSCSYFCPENAISEQSREIGNIKVDTNKHIYTGRLNIGEPMAPPVIKLLKNCITKNYKDIVLDAPPGTSCPVVETIAGVDYVVLVTEATPFGLNDLKLAVEVVKKTNIPVGVVVNKTFEEETLIAKYCESENIPVLLNIPHDNWIASEYSKGNLITSNEEYKNMFIKLREDIQNDLKGRSLC